MWLQCLTDPQTEPQSVRGIRFKIETKWTSAFVWLIWVWPEIWAASNSKHTVQAYKGIYSLTFQSSLTFLGSAASSTGLNVCPWCLSPSLQIRHTSSWSVSQNSLSLSWWSEHTSFSGSSNTLTPAPQAATFPSLRACCSLKCSLTAVTIFRSTRLDRRSHMVKGRLHSGHCFRRQLWEWLLIHCRQNVWSQSRLTGSVKSPKHTEHWICFDSRESITTTCLKHVAWQNVACVP